MSQISADTMFRDCADSNAASPVSILRAQLQVDGRRVVSIPATTKSVDVKIDASNVKFTADGKTVGGVRR